MAAIVRKELADYFTSIRCLVLFVLVMLASAATLYVAQQQIRGSGTDDFIFLALFTTQGDVVPSFVSFMALYFIPLIGITLGFDAINSERSNGTLSRLMSQPVYRDSVINGKFLAGLITLTIMVATSMLLVAGYGMSSMVGVPPPGAEEIIRLFLYLVMAVIYGAFWIGISALFSVLFRRVAISLLVSVAVWLFFSFFWTMMIAPAIAGAIAPVGDTTESLIRAAEMQQLMLRFSPGSLFSEATISLLHPVYLETATGFIGAMASGQIAYMLARPLSLGQSLLTVWPHLTSLVSLSVICFAVSYILFMRQEIRAS